MLIITNADDFGMRDECTDATIECFEKGALTSATIMPKMPATAKAVEYARSRPDLSFGVHLTYVCDTVEAPVSDPAGLPALVTGDGRFLPSNTVRVLALRNKLPVDQIVRETEAQIASLIDRGVRISHVDSHGHLHKFTPFREALRRVLPKFGITRVRTAQDLYLKKPYKSFNYWYGPIFRRRLSALFDTTAHFYMPSSAWDESWARSLMGLLPRLKGATLEVGVHPGYEEPWRVLERTGLIEFADLARAAGHTVAGWKDLPARGAR